MCRAFSPFIFAWELRGTTIKVSSSDPGYTATDLNQNQGHQTVEEGAAETIRLALLPDEFWLNLQAAHDLSKIRRDSGLAIQREVEPFVSATNVA